MSFKTIYIWSSRVWFFCGAFWFVMWALGAGGGTVALTCVGLAVIFGYLADTFED